MATKGKKKTASKKTPKPESKIQKPIRFLKGHWYRLKSIDALGVEWPSTSIKGIAGEIVLCLVSTYEGSGFAQFMTEDGRSQSIRVNLVESEIKLSDAVFNERIAELGKIRDAEIKILEEQIGRIKETAQSRIKLINAAKAFIKTEDIATFDWKVCKIMPILENIKFAGSIGKAAKNILGLLNN